MNGELGSIDSTATLRPASRRRLTSAPISVDLPAPGAPVKPTIAAVGAAAALALWPQVLRFGADVASVRVEHPGARAWLDDPRPTEWGKAWLV